MMMVPSLWFIVVIMMTVIMIMSFMPECDVGDISRRVELFALASRKLHKIIDYCPLHVLSYLS